MSATVKFVPGAPERKGFYERCRALVFVVSTFFFGLDVQGIEHIPTSGPAILVSNHLSFWDIPSLAFKVRRMVHYMAKSEYAKNRLANWTFTNLEAFFVRRGEGDMEAIRNALAVLKAGQILAIYPEGHRTEEHSLIEAHEGFTLIAFKSGAPVIPVATWGSELTGKGFRFGFFRPTVHVRYGAPIHLAPAGKKYTREELMHATNQIMGTIAAMLPPAYRGFYAEAANQMVAEPTASVATKPTSSEAGI